MINFKKFIILLYAVAICFCNQNLYIDDMPEAVAAFAETGQETSVEAEEKDDYALFRMPGLNNKTQGNIETEVVPCGLTVGVQFNMDGLMVLGTGAVKTSQGESNPSDGKLFAGDLIIEVNGNKVSDSDELIAQINTAEDKELTLKVQRNNKALDVKIVPVVSKEDGVQKLGCWVRDSTQGIGTITYYNPQTGAFGALGHGVADVDTGKLMTVRDGEILKSSVIDIKQGREGSPGELIGATEKGNVIGSVELNTNVGIYGYINLNSSDLPSETMKTAKKSDVYAGPAKILSNIEGDTIKSYDVYIEKINGGGDESKGMVIRITDPELLSKTNGIVKGMSGSPIIQDNTLVGAVTHVFVQNPQQGYGIFIENMLKQEKLL